jgi:hypothetical protein
MHSRDRRSTGSQGRCGPRPRRSPGPPEGLVLRPAIQPRGGRWRELRECCATSSAVQSRTPSEQMPATIYSGTRCVLVDGRPSIHQSCAACLVAPPTQRTPANCGDASRRRAAVASSPEQSTSMKRMNSGSFTARAGPRSIYAETGGLRPAHGAASSSCPASERISSSSPKRPTNCTPTGRPASFQCSGSDIAGWPVTLNGGVKGT